MILKKLTLFNFRNYDNLNLNLNPKLNIFLGKNGMGKTNIIEAIYFLAITKSYRSTVDKKMIMENKTNTKIKGKVEYQNHLAKNLEIVLNEENKRALIDNNEVKTLSKYISNLNVILFSPETIELLRGYPAIRRKFMNIEMGQINAKYIKQLSVYNNLLKLRNEYLKNINNNKVVDEVYFDIITNKLIDNAIYIYQQRNEFIKKLNEYIPGIYKQIDKAKDVRLKYLIPFKDCNSETIKEYLKDKFLKNFKREVEQGKTIFGPHCDDFLFVFNGRDLKFYGSQGQQRMVLLTLKLAEVKIFKELTKENPILLLDDIFSELDKYKKKNILKYIDNDIQVFITATELRKKNNSPANIYTIDEGKVTKVEEVK